MKTNLTFCLFLLISNFLFTQELDSTLIFSDEDKDLAALELIGGSFLSQPGWLSEMNTFSQYTTKKPLQMIGLSYTIEFNEENVYRETAHFSLVRFLPHEIQLTDSLSGRMGGFIFSTNLYGVNLTPRSFWTSWIIGVGFNTGRVTLRSKDFKTQKNPYFAPALFFNPRFFIGPLVLAIRGEYQYDVSKTRWRSLNFSSKEKTFSPLDFNQSGLNCLVSLGYLF